jgi:prolyl oligopeptidase
MNEEGVSPDEDPYRWLEDVTGDDALAWVRDRNTETVRRLAQRHRFGQLRDEIREVLDADNRIPYVTRRGEHLYNFWRDAEHPRGRWRRTTLDEYRQPNPNWEMLLDIDALAETEGENWVWDGARVLRPGHRRALIELSRGGADAAVVREFDLVELRFVPDGFTLPEAKSQVGWIDVDRIYVGTDFGPGSLTSSGYPRIIKEWRRGTPLDEAEIVFEGKPDDVSVYAYHDPTEGYERDFAGRSIDFYRSERYLRTASGELLRIDLPEDVELGTHREWLLVTNRSPWTVNGATYPAGVLLAIRFDDFLRGDRQFDVLFTPDEHTSLSYFSWTRNHLIVNTLSDVRTKLVVLTPEAGGWRTEPLTAAPELTNTDIVDTDPDDSDEYFLASSGYTEPATLRYGRIGAEAKTLKQAPSFFAADGLSVRQLFATSADGTKIPYFVVGDPQTTPAPTLLTGYGGFEVSLTPGYSGTIGRGWLARGGTYVVANIRGGGEYGPDWHQSAIKANRHKVYEDFVAVATDLVDQGITTVPQLGIQGGSNGGLLMGVMLTRYPELFGAVVCQVPLLDMLRYPELLAGASWMAEYGDPRDESVWSYLRPFSPYHNVASVHSGVRYPPTLFITSTRDDRVHPGHARKMVARMRELGHDVWYHENIEGGHGAASDNSQLAEKWALVFEFLWQTLAVNGTDSVSD